MTGTAGLDSEEHIRWTNRSVRALAGDADPLTTISDLVNRLLLAAADAGLTGPPIDPLAVAEQMGIELRPRADVADARIVTAGPHARPGRSIAPLRSFVPTDTALAVEYNPARPRGRLRYSLAHELAHAFFPDVADIVRHRTGTGALQEYAGDDNWQLELLCNVAAAELLMPTEAVEGLLTIDPDIDFLMAQRARFDVSTEALLRRLVHATPRSMAVVAASRIHDDASAPLRVDYVQSSRSWSLSLPRGALVDPTEPLGQPTAVGQTARGPMILAGLAAGVQAVGIPPYPGRSYPRILALVEPQHTPSTAPSGIVFVTADIAAAKADGPLLIAHVVSDSARSWSRRGVAAALARRYPSAASAFHSWALADPTHLQLGAVHSVPVTGTPDVTVVSMVAQRGYGPSATPRLSYTALADALSLITSIAIEHGAEVHVPRIGAGQAGGRWDLIEGAVERTLVRAGVAVTVYTKPPETPRANS
ncbi:MAG: ImmA/IrrE family metallo-endopeptidase [Actinomycetota bacterium]|nr:ImmA/IrrE family metallo-endopeptidase [Actinomycetota bacterium]